MAGQRPKRHHRLVSIILTIVIKISAKPEFLTLGFIDYLDFGFDLAISSIIVLLAGAKDDTEENGYEKLPGVEETPGKKISRNFNKLI